MKVFDKRTNEQVDFEVADNGYIITTTDGTKKNISQATLNRWYKAVDDEGNDTSFPVIAKKIVEKLPSTKKEKTVDPAEAAKKLAEKEAKIAKREQDKVEKELAKKARAEEKEAKNAERLALKQQKDAEKLAERNKRKEEREKAKSERLANGTVKKDIIQLVPSPLDVSFVSDEVVKETDKSISYATSVKVGEFTFNMKDTEYPGRYKRGTVSCSIKNNLGEIIYTSPKESAKDCVNWLNKDNIYTEEQVFAINNEIRQARKTGITKLVEDLKELEQV